MDDTVGLRRDGQAAEADEHHGKDYFYCRGERLGFEQSQTGGLFQQSADDAGGRGRQEGQGHEAAGEDGK